MKIPYVDADSPIRDFSIRALIAGIVFGAIFGSANAYLGLRVGLTISTAIPLAVISVAFFKFLNIFGAKSSILEANISQTAGSASSSLASGIIFTIPAMFMWGMKPEILQIAMLACLGGTLGILFMIPLREFLIVKEHENLPYPEGTSAARVLIASDEGGATAKFVFLGMGIGAIYKAFLSFIKIIPETVALKLNAIPKAVIQFETMPALLGVGYILNYRIASIMVAGGLLSWLVLIPTIAYFAGGMTSPIAPGTTLISEMSAQEIWKNYVRFIGAGAVAFAGILTVCKALPTMFSSLKIALKSIVDKNVAAELESVQRTDRSLSMKTVFIGVFIVLAILATVPGIIGINTTWYTRLIAAICIGIFAFMFVTVSSRIVGLIGVSSNPTSGMAIVTMLGTSLLFVLIGWTDEFAKAAVITIGTVVCVGASIAGDISQDLKSGYLLGATPKKQQLAELAGVIGTAYLIAFSVCKLGEAYTFGSAEIPAPQATLMKTVVDGVLSSNLPWGLILTGGMIALVVEIIGLPCLPFSVGVYLPLSTMTPVFVGGLIRRFVEYRNKKSNVVVGKDAEQQAKEQGVLLSSGLIAGEGILGIAIACFALVAGHAPKGVGFTIPGVYGEIISFALFLLLGAYLYRIGRKR
ncbi:MAG TPA: oligopeptide transporter, OPT family [Planctomycetota bacterium]|nr:oligopeptide transporter, OPT family [Planctomycetota bacterium]